MNIRILISLLAVLAMNSLIACGRSSSSSPQVATEPTTEAPKPTPTPDPVIASFELTSTYEGELLTLQYPSSEGHGSIVLHAQDANTLFSAMDVQAVKGKDPQGKPVKSRKDGLDLYCWISKPATSHSTPPASCELDFDYVTGKISPAPLKSKFDQGVQQSTNYQSKNLTLFAFSPRSLTNLQLDGRDAEALFWTLQAPIKQSPGTGSLPDTMLKAGQDMSCTRFYVDRKKVIYTCNLNFSFRTGEVFAYGTR